MEVIEIHKMEDCFDGSMIYRYTFAQAVEEKFVVVLGRDEKLQYFPDFSRPFYKIITRSGLQIKGIVGEDNIEATFPREDKWGKKRSFEDLIRGIPV